MLESSSCRGQLLLKFYGKEKGDEAQVQRVRANGKKGPDRVLRPRVSLPETYTLQAKLEKCPTAPPGFEPGTFCAG